jgi:hypothetical protein
VVIIRNLAVYTFLGQKRNTDMGSELNVREQKDEKKTHEKFLRMTADGLAKILLNYKARGY